LHCPLLPIGKRAKCSSSDTCNIFPPREKSSSSAAAGTTAPASNTSWASAPRQEHERFLALCPEVEKYIVDAGIILIKLWLEAGMEEQEKRFAARIDDPLRQWKLSPMDLESYRRWYDYSKARDMMLKATNSKHAPWYVVRSEDKKRARLNCISHLLKTIPYKRLPPEQVKLPERSDKNRYNDLATLRRMKFVPERY
jgi:polyphosphate kinase